MPIINESEYLSDEIFRKDSGSFFMEFSEEIEDPDDTSKTIIVPLDITDWTIFYLVKKNLFDLDADALIFKEIVDHVDVKNGKTIVELSSGDTDFAEGYYQYIVYVVTNLGENLTIVQDNFIIKSRGKE